MHVEDRGFKESNKIKLHACLELIPRNAGRQEGRRAKGTTKLFLDALEVHCQALRIGH